MSVVRSAQIVRFSLKGNLTFRDKDNFTPILDAVTDPDRPDVVVDLSQLDHVDSFGIGLLLLAHEQAVGGKRALTVTNPHGAVARVFELANLETVLNLRQDVPVSIAPAPKPRGGIGYHLHPAMAGRDESCVSLAGRLVFAEHEAFEEIIALLAQSPGQKLLLDLSGLEFMDSAGLSMIMIAREEAEIRGQTLMLRNVHGAVAQLLSLSALEFMLEG